MAKNETFKSNPGDPVPCSRFDYRNYSADQRLASFQHLTDSLYETWAIGAPEDFRAEALGYRVGNLIFTRVVFSPARFVRSAQHLESEGSGFLMLQQQYTGSELLLMEHGNVHIDAGNLYLRDWSFPFDSLATAMRLDSLVIPRDRLNSSALLEADHPVISLPAASPGGRMLAELWSELFSRLPEIPLGDAEMLCEAFLGFLDGILGYGERARPNKTLSSMEQFLRVRLRQDVGVEHLCRHFHVSRSQVFRLFQPHGGVNAFLKRLRLERCYVELLSADPSYTRVSDVATSWLLNDPSLFSRQFRSMFGQSPSSVLGQGHESRLRPPDGPHTAPLSSESYRDYRIWLSQAAQSSIAAKSG